MPLFRPCKRRPVTNIDALYTVVALGAKFAYLATYKTFVIIATVRHNRSLIVLPNGHPREHLLLAVPVLILLSCLANDKVAALMLVVLIN